ncbi:inositol 2-dehydrogenase [Thermotoga sp. KOL6]|uniref:inositol 2-dehydrogenase n=1 Tax=Thermotoga sp. KOL6 TaxID=126741 RepID=UPI000C75DF03|nr:inositol 2-dehydrogenase [Thermotoga sp. KOL6]PLV59144.1 inositol 2-dehydrogenase [Thermotoga sp. KOL6]
MRLGVIGLGRIGTIHAENIMKLDDVELYAISDVREDHLKKMAERFNVARAYVDPYELIEDQKVDAVLVCSSTDTHADLVVACAKAKKHVFCEKPLSLILEDVNKMIEEAKKNKVILFVGFNRRFDRNFRKVKEAVEKGTIGEPHILRITSRDPEPPPIDYIRVSGGIFLDMTIHDFDMARYVMGEEVEEVFSTGSVLIDKEIGMVGDVDTTVVVLRFKSGALGVIDNSRKAIYGYDQRLEVFGTRGKISVDNVRESTVVFTDEHGDRGSRYLYFFLERYKEAYLEELKAFVDSVRNNKPPAVSGEDGKMALLLGYAAKKSMEEKRPVRLEEVML